MRRARDRSTSPQGSRGTAKTLGERIREARLAAGLTQQQLAGTELTKAFISHLELGRARPSPRSLEFIAKRLGKDIAYFLGRDVGSREYLLELHERAAEAASAISDWASQRKHARAALRLADGKRSVPALRLLAQAESATGRGDQAMALTRKALSLLGDGGEDAREFAFLLSVRANARLSLGQLAPAAEEIERALDALDRHKIQDSALRSRLHMSLGTAFRRLGDVRQARIEFERALETANKVDAIRLAGRAYIGLASAHYDGQDFSSAIRYYQRAQELLERASDAKNELVALRCIAEIHLDSGDIAAARVAAERAAVRAIETGQKEELAGARIVLAQVAIREGRPEEGLRLAREAEKDLAGRLVDGVIIQRADAIRVIADAYHAQRRWADSDREYARALAMVEKLSRLSWDRMVGLYAQRLYDRGKAREAYEWLVRTSRSSGSTPSVVRDRPRAGASRRRTPAVKRLSRMPERSRPR